MINRELIRLKVVQISYAYYQTKDQDVEAAEAELEKSLSNAYYLYNMLLLLLLDVKRVAEDNVEAAQMRIQRLGLKQTVSRRFVENKFLRQLEANEQLLLFKKNLKKDANATATQINFDWRDKEDFVRRILAQMEQTEAYKEYMAKESVTYEDDRELVRKLYRFIVAGNDELDDELEGLSLYWNDDKAIIDTFVLKTIKRFEEANGGEQSLMPQYQSEDDKAFAATLLKNSLSNEQTYRDLIAGHTRNWNMERMPLMDVVILQTGLAEIISFPQIPINVSINEYVEIAKMYSTPRSGSYVNGMLDNIAKTLITENKLIGKVR